MGFTFDQLNFVTEVLGVGVPNSISNEKGKSVYDPLKSAAIDTINKAATQPAEYGGGKAILEDLKALEGLESKNKWKDAIAKLSDLKNKALNVLDSLSYSETKDKILPKLEALQKASTADPNLIKTSDETWAKIENLAKSGDFKNAEKEINELKKLVDAKIEPALKIEYAKQKQIVIGTILEAVSKPAESGANDVKEALKETEKLESQANWTSAKTSLETALESAEIVLAKNSYLETAKRVLPKISKLEGMERQGVDKNLIKAALKARTETEKQAYQGLYKSAEKDLCEIEKGINTSLNTVLERTYEGSKANMIGKILEASKGSSKVAAEIKNDLAKVDKLEKSGNLADAMNILDQSWTKARDLKDREEFIIRRQEVLPKIQSALKIGGDFEKIGKKIGSEWKKVEGYSERNLYKEALLQIDDVMKYIGETEKNLKKPQAKNLDELKDLKKDIAKKLNGDDPEKIRKVALKIFENNAKGEKLGIDTGAKAREDFEDTDKVWTANLCEATFKVQDWFSLKACRKEGKITIGSKKYKFSDDNMWKLVQYRRKVVNEAIDGLRKKYPTLIAKASGSEDIESDIDITFATPNSGQDVDAAMEFNNSIKTRYGKPPGRVFDVNIYPRDYGAIRESMNPTYNIDPIRDHDIDEPETEASVKLDKIDQDVASLLKQRRFMEAEDFNKMLKSVLASISDPEAKKRAQKQYEEGEDIFLLTSLEKVTKLQKAVKLPKPDKKEDPKVTELREKLAALDKIKGTKNAAEAQKLIPEVLELYEHAFPSETMDVTDAQYLERMKGLREDQGSIRSLKDTAKPENHHPGKTCDEAHKEEKDHEKWRASKVNALEVKVKKEMFTNIVFANEAIMTHGALKHVVEVLQEKDPKFRKEKIEKISASDLMQSVNEQVADLFKETKHYKGVVEEAENEAKGSKKKEIAARRATGEGYIHASKYLVRLLDAANALNEKYDKEPTVVAPYSQLGNQDLASLKKKIEGVMLKVRKSVDIPPEAKGEIGVLEVSELFPAVKDIAGFQQLISEFAIEINKRIRSLKDFTDSQSMESPEERRAETAYFKEASKSA